MRPRVAVVGGGIAGIAAALELVERADVTVFDAADRLGGPVRTVEFADTRVETGPDSFLARRPEMIDFATTLGFGDALTSPAATEAGIWSRGAVRKMPAGLVLGVPRSLKGLADSGIVSRAAIARAALDRVLPATKVGEDIGMGDLVQRRFGRQVQQRLVDPLMGGVHAGRSELLSTAVAAPQLLAAGRKGRSLMASLPEAPPSTDPVFLTVASGLGEVIDAAAKQIPDIRCDTPIDELRVVGAGWEILGEAFEGVIVATHAPVTARLVADAAPDAADALRSVEYASVVLTLLAYPTAEMREPFRLSGFLVPRPEKKLLSAISWSSAKWAHHAGRGIEIVRASTGRIDDRRHEDMDDGALVAALHDEIAQATGVGSAAPTYARVNRWPSALPQFRVGHLTKVAARAHASAATAPAPLALAGSAYEGLGLPACVASGRAAARAVSVRLGI